MEHSARSRENPLIDQWYGQFKTRLVQYLRRGVHVDADVQDLAHEVYCRLLRVKNPEEIQSPPAYLFRIATHVLDEWRTQDGRFPGDDSVTADNLPGENNPDLPLENAQQQADIEQALSHLPAIYRAAVVLQTQHNMTYAQIASHLDISERMVKRYIVKAYAALRQRLAQQREVQR